MGESQSCVAVGDRVLEEVFVREVGDVGEESAEHDDNGRLKDTAD